LALHGWTVWSDVAPGRSVPFYLLPSLGGNNTLRSYPDYRFHDLNAAVLNAESRWALFTHVDVALFVDAGNVGPQFQDLNFDKRSYGGGIRLHTDRATFARLDVAQGAEGWRVVFRTSDPFRIARLTRRVAAVPFVP
jgi:outer membrane protein assembly factor BamA